MSKAVLVPCPVWAEQAVQHDYVEEDERHAAVVDEVQHRRSLVEASLQNAQLIEVAFEEVVHGDTEHHKDWQEFVGVDCYAACSYPDGHIDLQQVEVRMERPASHLEQRQQVHHFEWHMPKLLGPQTAQSVVRPESAQHNRLQCGLHRRHQERPRIVQLKEASKNRTR